MPELEKEVPKSSTEKKSKPKQKGAKAAGKKAHFVAPADPEELLKFQSLVLRPSKEALAPPKAPVQTD